MPEVDTDLIRATSDRARLEQSGAVGVHYHNAWIKGLDLAEPDTDFKE